eukprot:10830125-Prorocentrum_lima.AAC.1
MAIIHGLAEQLRVDRRLPPHFAFALEPDDEEETSHDETVAEGVADESKQRRRGVFIDDICGCVLD